MSKQKTWFPTSLIILMLTALVSCHEDISTIGSELLGDEIPSGILDESYSVKAYNQKTFSVQTNDLTSYRLGIYKDPTFGKSTSNFLTQLLLEANNPTFGEEATVDSVLVYIPFYSREIPRDTTMTYKLDSIYGNDPINIKVYESNYYLRDYDPQSNFEKPQPYYSHQGSEFENFLGQELGHIEGFKPSAKGFVINEGKDNEERLQPGLRFALSKEFFQERIIDKEGSAELRNNNNFRDYLRGLYFKVEAGDAGNLFLFDVSKAEVSVFYTYLNDQDKERQRKLKLGFGGVSVNTFENDPLPNHIESAISNPDNVNGDQNLFLRGGEGSMAVVELFGEDLDNNGVPDQLELLRAKKWMINEANLIFYVNQELLAQETNEPERIMIYNLKTNKVLMDYLVDPTNGLLPIDAFNQHLGRLKRGSDNQGVYYKIRLTNHISNLINKDSINVPLGIVVSQNVTEQEYKKLESPQELVKKIPTGDVMSPKGTVLHGNNSGNEDKKLKLQIYYTEPK